MMAPSTPDQIWPDGSFFKFPCMSNLAKRRRLNPVESKERGPLRPRALPRSDVLRVEEKGGPLLPPPYLQARLDTTPVVISSNTVTGTPTGQVSHQEVQLLPTSKTSESTLNSTTLTRTNFGLTNPATSDQTPIGSHQSDSPTSFNPDQITENLSGPEQHQPIPVSSSNASNQHQEHPQEWKQNQPATAVIKQCNSNYATIAKQILSTVANDVSTMLAAMRSFKPASPEHATRDLGVIIAAAHDLLDDVTCDLADLLTAMGVAAIEDEELTSQMQVSGHGGQILIPPGIIGGQTGRFGITPHTGRPGLSRTSPASTRGKAPSKLHVLRTP